MLGAIDASRRQGLVEGWSVHGGIGLTADGAWIGETFPKVIRRVPLP